ncbi:MULTISPECIES: DnaB-like helicase N-terminal domain-containing protein [unclassified Streptomyces]|uniref:DnaB-like helicase N-terminal domain-containing protein n=1 Tax=unclassified Streptomyces TaxID=2593676 RepID=UPI00081B79A7|nr:MULTISPECIES: DnaB-like helicase N-terminal domain-containing protein [unclassified Streptomyces]MYQ82559.1 replicative DNA helicase [Streptomyces sp. SID4936]SCD44613.1 DnaB-like helicase N terminal domain-containing protein [Streptomyces sp. DvalAA-43]
MPRTPDPEADDLDAVPPPHPVFHIEQALLGALLLDPRHLDDVTGIAPASFSTAAHTALFATILSLPVPDPVEHATTTKWLDQVLAAARDQARGLSVLYLQTLIQVCPSARHAPAYARIVEAEHSRRRLAAAAQRLMRTAVDISLPQRVTTTLAEAENLTVVVDDIAARFPPHAGSMPRTPAPPTAIHHDEEALDEERLLLATSTLHASSVGRMRWLTPGDFTHSLHAGLWQCLTALTRRGTPVDRMTVLWEAQHRGLLTTGARPRELLDLLAGTSGSPEHWGERVLQRSVLTTAHHAGRRIEAYAGDPATTPYQLVVGSRRALADLSAVRTRWQHAASPPPTDNPTRTKSAAAPRAGPPRTTAPLTARNAR